MAADHRVCGLMVIPAAVHIEFVLATALQLSGSRFAEAGQGVDELSKSCTISNIELLSAAIINVDARDQWLQCSITRATRSFTVSTALYSNGGHDPMWVSVHAQGTVRIDPPTVLPPPARPPRPSTDRVDVPRMYSECAERGLQYSRRFRGLVSATRSSAPPQSSGVVDSDTVGRSAGVVSGQVALCDGGGGGDGYLVHPALLDSALHTTLAFERHDPARHNYIYRS